MRADRHALLGRLIASGVEHDSATPERLDRYRNIGADTGVFLHMFMMVLRPHSVLEIGTSNGYSTIWLADAAEQLDAVVHSIDDHDRQDEATRNLSDAGISDTAVHLHRGRAQDLLASLGVHDLVFLDAERSEYPALWSSLESVISRDGVLIVDNALSHPDEMKPFFDLLGGPSSGWSTWIVPVGSGQLVARRSTTGNRRPPAT